MKQSVILTFHGRVQRVGFRYFVKEKADAMNISGFVKNKLNGMVYIEAEGESEQLLLFIHFCKQGPPHARVDKVDIQWCPVQNFMAFERK